MTPRKLVVIGLDCATPDILFTDFLDELPNMARLVRNGVHGTIRSTDPPITVPAWTVMTSGVSPGRHGFFGFRNRVRGSYEDGFLATGNHVKWKRVWDYLSEAGHRVSVHAVPQSFPAYPVNGVMTACFLTPDATHGGFAWPREFGDEVRAMNPDFMVDVRNFRTDDKDQLLSEIHRCLDDHFDLAEHAVTTRDWDFFMMVEMGVDRIHHGMWQYHDPKHRLYPGDDNPYRHAILDYYKRVDARIGRFLEHVPEDACVMLVSDHGAKRMDGAVNVNDWLRREGYLVLKNAPTEPTRFRAEDVDWSRTKAWAYGGYHARVFVNLEGREPEGTVPQREYAAFLAELAESLKRVPGPDGEPIPDTVVRQPEDEYGTNGVDLSAAPDLHVYFGDMHWRASQNVGHPEPWSMEAEVGPDGATHHWHGVFAFHDPLNPVAGGRRVDGLHIADVCPTILKLYGIVPPDDLEGTPIDGIPYPAPAPDARPPSPRRDPAHLRHMAGAEATAPSAHRGITGTPGKGGFLDRILGRGGR